MNASTTQRVGEGDETKLLQSELKDPGVPFRCRDVEGLVLRVHEWAAVGLVSKRLPMDRLLSPDIVAEGRQGHARFARETSDQRLRTSRLAASASRPGDGRPSSAKA